MLSEAGNDYLAFVAGRASWGGSESLSDEDRAQLADSIYENLLDLVTDAVAAAVLAATAQTSIALELMAPSA